jgi:hypothetical protein
VRQNWSTACADTGFAAARSRIAPDLLDHSAAGGRCRLRTAQSLHHLLAPGALGGERDADRDEETEHEKEHDLRHGEAEHEALAVRCSLTSNGA